MYWNKSMIQKIQETFKIINTRKVNSYKEQGYINPLAMTASCGLHRMAC